MGSSRTENQPALTLGTYFFLESREELFGSERAALQAPSGMAEVAANTDRFSALTLAPLNRPLRRPNGASDAALQFRRLRPVPYGYPPPLQQLRTWETEQKMTPTPALALTAFAGRDDSRKAREAGYQQHLAKPVNVEQVVKAIAVLTRRH